MARTASLLRNPAIAAFRPFLDHSEPAPLLETGLPIAEPGGNGIFGDKRGNHSQKTGYATNNWAHHGNGVSLEPMKRPENRRSRRKSPDFPDDNAGEKDTEN